MVPYKGKYKVTQPYKGATHKGIDLVGLDNKNIYAPVSGYIAASRTDTYPDGGMGNYIKIREANGRYHILAHLSKLLIDAGQMVNEGDIIGVEGNTGHSFGSHCHYEIRENLSSSSFIDVATYMNIPNQIGTYESGGSMTKEEAKKIVKEKAGLSDSTIRYIADDYRWGDTLIIKLAEAMEK